MSSSARSLEVPAPDALALLPLLFERRGEARDGDDGAGLERDGERRAVWEVYAGISKANVELALVPAAAGRAC